MNKYIIVYNFFFSQKSYNDTVFKRNIIYTVKKQINHMNMIQGLGKTMETYRVTNRTEKK